MMTESHTHTHTYALQSFRIVVGRGGGSTFGTLLTVFIRYKYSHTRSDSLTC